MYHITAIILIIIFLLQSKIKSRKALHIACLTPFLVVIALRYGVGADYFSYEYIYNFLDVSSFGNMMSSMDNIEIGFKSIFYVGRILNLSYAVTIGLISLVMTLGVALLIDAKSENVPLSYLLFYACFFLPWNLNAVRQGLAIALSLYLMFGNLILEFKYKVLLLVALMSLHVSAIIVLPLYLVSKKDIGKKNMAIIIGVSMVLSLLPLNSILSLFENVPFLSKLALYATSSSGLLDFQSISRIVILAPLLYFYDRFEDKVMVNFSLLSFALYFTLKSNELIASRMSIYGFFLIIILYPTIYTFGFWKKKMVLVIAAVAVLFSGMFYVKEFNAAFRQANFVGERNRRNWVTILNRDEYQMQFLNQFNLITQANRLCRVNSVPFFENTNFEEVTYTEYTEGDTFLAVKFPNEKYGVINQEGKVVTIGVYDREPEIRDHILTTHTTGSHFLRSIHIDLRTMEEVALESIQDQLLDFEKRQMEFDAKWFNIRQMYYEELVDTPLNDLVPVDQFNHLALIGFSQPFWYNVVESTVHLNSFMFFVDNNFEPFNDRVYNLVDPFGLSKMARGYTSCGKEIINEYGEVIWYEK